jgi:hypothetical protein
MRRAVPLLVAAVLLSACASGHRSSSGSDVIDYRPHVPRSSVTPLANRRERRAGSEAERLLKRVPLPPGATRLENPPPASDQLSRSGLGVSTVSMTADRYSFWRVPESGPAVIAFEKKHMLAGLRGEGGGSSPDGWRSEEFYGPVVDGSPQRAVSVTVARFSGRLVLRLDAGVSWIYPRSPSEVVPAAVREIDIRDETIDRRMTEPAKVARIVAWFDRLNVVQPGPTVGCMAIGGSPIELVFRSASGARLADAVVPSFPATNCDSIQFSVGGKRQTSLIDATSGRRAFANRLARLLGVQFPER